MININFDNLNNLEIEIHDKLSILSKTYNNIKITDASKQCNCSISKISKFVKKLGFENYKQYIDFLYERNTNIKSPSSEILRLQDFLNNFDDSIVYDFIDELKKYNKIVLLGYGPSYICAQYLENKLRMISNKLIYAVPDESSAKQLIDDNSILIIFSTTGQFTSFENIFNYTQSVCCQFLLLIEEYNIELIKKYNNIIMLTNDSQSPQLRPFEKSRSIFFIFIEQVGLTIINEKICL